MRPLLTAAVLLAFGLGLRARAATPTTNPADLDREVIRLMTQGPDSILQADDLDAVPVDATLKAYLDERRPVLDLMHQAAAMPHADWGPIDGDIEKVMPSLNGARAAVMVTWLNARSEATQGRPAAAVDTLLDGLALARHVGQRQLLITTLVEVGCESGSIDRLAGLMPKLPAEVVAGLPAALDALPPAARFAAVIDGERVFGRAMLEKQFAVPTTLPAGVVRTNAVPPAVMAMADGLGPFYDALKAAADKSPTEFAAAADAAVAKMPLNVLARTITPGIGRAREPSAVVETKWAMLRTAAAIAQKGPDALVASRDPFGDGPFTRSDTAHGYRLTGKFVGRDGPVTLTVGQ